MFKFTKLLAHAAMVVSCVLTNHSAYCWPGSAHNSASFAKAVRQSAYSAKELDDTQVGITIVFKSGAAIPSDAELNAFLPLEGHRGPFGRRFVASARKIKEALKLDGFDHWVTAKGLPFYASAGTVTLPAAWAQQVRVVLGLNDKPVAKPHYRRAQPHIRTSQKVHDTSLPAGWPPYGFFPPQLAEIYEFPRGGLGEGQTIGLVELTSPGNPAGYYPADVALYFTMIGITPPVIEDVSVDGAVNSPTNPSSNDVEVCLDIETSGSVAPNAKILVFFAPDTDAGLYDCFAEMLETYAVPVISCSWSDAEVFYDPGYMLALEELFAAYASQSTVCCSTGDSGSTDDEDFAGIIAPPGTAQPTFPSSCPHVLAVGGTSLLPNGDHTKRLKGGEVVWNWQGGTVAGGGGVSTIFGVPDYQSNNGIHLASINNGKTGRAKPDVALMADFFQGYNIRIDGYNSNLYGGTSASTPMWAGLIARLNYINGGKPLGFINPLLYANPHVLTKIKHGSVGQYFAHCHYDACTGLGVPSKCIIDLLKPQCPQEELKPYHYELPKNLLSGGVQDKQLSYHVLLGNRYQAPQGATKLGSYCEHELENESIAITIIFKEKVGSDIDASLKPWAHKQGLSWEGDRGPFARRLSGTAKALCKALGITGFDHWQVGDITYRVHASDVHLPADELWVSNLLTITGLETQPLRYSSAKPKQEVLRSRKEKRSHQNEEFPFPFPGVPPGDWSLGYFPFELARIYDYPKKAFGAGQSVAVIELSDGLWGYSDNDLSYYWAYMGIANPPVVTWVGVDGVVNNYTGDIFSDDWIVTADIEIIGTIAPDSSIQVVFAPNTTDGLYNALVEAFASSNTIVSTVWGQPEAQWPLSTMLAIDNLVADATNDGVTVIASSGSHGSSDGISDGLAHVDFPASSPHVLAVGTTTLLSDTYHKERVLETAWNEGYGLNATGGGVSDVFAVPEYQKQSGINPKSANPGHHTGRGVPDVSSVGDPLGYYAIPIYVDGFNFYTYPAPPGPYASLTFLDLPCGTVATPTWAGLVARLKSIASPEKALGLLQPELYKNRCKWFVDIIQGSNGAYCAHKGYDLTTGLGVPNGKIVEITK